MGLSGSRASVAVVGGGVIGCWSAYYLAQRGCHVTLIERNAVGSGSSGGNCGYLCPSHVMPLCGPGAISHALPQLMRRGSAFSIPMRYDPSLWRWLLAFPRYCSSSHQTVAAIARDRLLKASTKLYSEYLAGKERDCHWDTKGLLLVHRGRGSLEAFQSTADRLASEFNISATCLTGTELMNLEPSLIDSLAGGWLFPADSHLDPARLMQSLHANLRELGVEILEQTDVYSLQISRGRIESLKTSAGSIDIDQLVLATGAETPKFASELRCRIPIVPGKGYSMTFCTKDELTKQNWPSVPMIFEDTHVAITPLGNELRIGSTMQLTGYDRTIDPRRLKMIRDNAQGYLRQTIRGEPEKTWIGWRPMAVDDIPCIDRSPAVQNAWVASGNGMIGMSTGTATGHLIADLICGDVPIVDPTPYSFARFQTSKTSKRQAVATSAVPA